MPIYHDRYDRDTKGWKKLLFSEGRGLQVAELNEIQSVLGDELHELGRTVWSDGQVVRGVEMVIKETTVELTPGVIYFGGYMHDFPGGEVAITKLGQEIIGVQFDEVIITETEDPGLHDPTTGWENSGYAGAHRLTYAISVTNGAADAVALYALQDGAWSADYRPASRASDIAAMLARRTYDESGDYLVRGLRCAIEVKDASQFWLAIDAGKAYVGGQEHTVPSRTRLAIDRPIQYDTVYDEPKTYQTGTSLYPLNTLPVKAIVGVTATVEETITFVKGEPNGSDLMPRTPLVSIQAVWQGGTNYSLTTNYLVSGNYIDWSPGGIEPASGSSYSVTLRYIKQMVALTDYVLTGSALDFSPAGDNPVHNTQVLVDYEYYLTRIDVLTMNRRGELSVISGQASQFPRRPTIPVSALQITTITLPANVGASGVVLTQEDRYRLTQEELAHVRRRVSDLEYNLAVTDLEQEAINVELPTSKKAIFTDSFRDSEKVNFGDPYLDCSIGLDDDDLGTLFPGYVVSFHDLGQPGRFLFRDYTLSESIRQGYATHQTNVNPHAAFNNAGVVTLTPGADIWIENVTIRKHTTITIPRGWWRQWTDRSLLSEEQISGTSREKVVTVNGSNFFPYSDNLRLVFDGILTPLFPSGGTLAGTEPETVQANQHGAFTATFTVEAGTPNGAHGILIYNEDNRGVSQYLIDGRLRNWLEHTTTVRVVPPRDPDPVAESFSVDSDIFVAAVDLFFAAKDSEIPVSVSIRNVVAGFPGPVVYAETVLLPSQVNISATATIATRAIFPEPALIRAGDEYAIVVATLSNQYYLHYARLGFRDQATQNWVLVNPFSGVMFTSANASTWTAYQEQDLKFVLHRAEFGVTDKTITLATNLAVDGSVITVMASEVIPSGCSIVWEIKADSDTAWSIITANELIDLGRVISTISVRVTLKGTSSLSPFLSSAIGLAVAKWDDYGWYSHRITTTSAFTKLRVYLDAMLPSDSGIDIEYTLDGVQWALCGDPISSQVVSSGYTEYCYEATGLNNPTSFAVGIDMYASTDRVYVPHVRRLRVIAT